MLKQKYADKDCTFAPKINKTSGDTSKERTQTQPYDRSRLGARKAINQEKARQSKPISDENCTFAPKINQKSMRMLEKKMERDQMIEYENVFERLSK